MRHLRAILFDARVHDKSSYEQLPMVQRIMNTVEKTITRVTPVEVLKDEPGSLGRARYLRGE